MKQIRRIGFALLCVSLGTGVLIACSGDDSVLLNVEDGGALDGRTNDATSGKDVNSPPIDSGNDSESNDSSTDSSVDAGSDAADSGVDAQADVEIPPVDAGAADADASDLAAEFPARLAATACEAAAQCCFGDPNTQNGAAVDGGTYQQQKCLNSYLSNGISQSGPGSSPDFTKLTYDQAKATECLGRMKALACNSNAAEYRALVSACYGVLQGNIPIGQPCARTQYCVPGAFCNTASAGGTCEAIRATGAACGDWTTNAGFGQFSCSNRFSGQPPRFCRGRSDAGTVLPTSEWKCENALPDGEYCSNDSYCTGVCASQKCADFISIYQPSFCSALATP